MTKLFFILSSFILLCLYNNCAPNQFAKSMNDLKAEGGTTVGTPMVSFKFDSYVPQATQEVSMCLERIELVPENPNEKPVAVDVSKMDRLLSPSGTSLTTESIPAGTYKDISVALSADCSSGKSLKVRNLNGEYASTQRLLLAFAGSSFLEQKDTTVVLNLQKLIDALQNVVNDSQVAPTAENNPGSWKQLADSWSALPTAGAPSARSDATAVWTGAKVLVWGGYNGFESPNVKNSGSAFDPAASQWSSLSGLGAPSARRQHSAVWTGSKMLIWGGTTGSGALQSGGQYDPATNAWAPISDVGAPTARKNHSALWIGNKMFIWGGVAADGSKLGDGGLYDPVTNSWSAISNVGSPTARAYNSAVWTGSKVIIWGGCITSSDDCPGTGTPLNSGALYDPTTNAWTAMSLSGVPAGRYRHSSVWTGSQLIVWGGEAYSAAAGHTYLNNGARYNPDSNTWTSISNVGAPGARSEHSAVWTGSRMIIWGGGDNSNFLGSGSSYDPVTNTWFSISMTSAPSARRYHSVIWTGKDMFIWGGWNNRLSPAYTNTGSRYAP